MCHVQQLMMLLAVVRLVLFICSHVTSTSTRLRGGAEYLRVYIL